MQHDLTIVWRRLDHPGHEFARLSREQDGWRLRGTALLAMNQVPCSLDYAIEIDDAWRTRRASVSGWVGNARIDRKISVGLDGRWTLDGAEAREVRTCLDIDLAFSPSTNLLPIRRLDLQVGQATPVRAAWLRFPEFDLQPLDQIYRRVDAETVRYESNGGQFVRDLRVNKAGMVVRYPDFWEAEARA